MSKQATAWVLGKYLLFQVPGWTIVGGLLFGATRWWELGPRLAVGLFALWVIKDFALFPFLRVAYEARGGPGGADALIGAVGVAQQTLDPGGYVRVGAELWQAETSPGLPPVPSGARVRVRAVRRLTLEVEPAPDAESRS